MSTDLSVFVGHWRSSGRTVARPGQPSVEIEGTDDYDWLPGRHFLIHRVDVRMGAEQVDVLEVIGEPDPAGDALLMRSFDHQGNTGLMRATVDGAGVWTFAGDSERATVVLGPDGRTMTATWERAEDGAGWVRWMQMDFVRRG